ncbi:Hypothetical protein FKW44_023815 [Caligus rogercresseyi]|uniref:Uncharacterized protein n=1 Tax=Caligus rogercresseyi TaxID=217165 RepID=A0A7T8GQ64_CALRO|nr:Hypothetical protein FKW44_023815 [Caligus rogercresseyi]
MVEIMSKFDMNIVRVLNPKDFRDFGIMDSKKYASKLIRILEKEAMTCECSAMVVALATAVKSKKRILVAMKKFAGVSWYKPTFDFFKNSTVQYTYE